MLIDKRRPVMLVGTAGTGKTVLMGDKMNGLSEDFMVANIPFNFYTTSEMLQRTLEKPLEKKAGRNFGPPGTRRLIYFVDDMNMPEVQSTSDFCCKYFYDKFFEKVFQFKGDKNVDLMEAGWSTN